MFPEFSMDTDMSESYISERHRSSMWSTANDNAYSPNESVSSTTFTPTSPKPPTPDPTFPAIATILTRRESLSDPTLTPAERHTLGQEMVNASRKLTEQAKVVMGTAWVAMDPETKSTFKLGREFDPRYPLKEDHPLTIPAEHERSVGKAYKDDEWAEISRWVDDLDIRNLGPTIQYKRSVTVASQGGVLEVEIVEWQNGFRVVNDRRVCVVEEDGQRWVPKGEEDKVRWSRDRNEGMRGSY